MFNIHYFFFFTILHNILSSTADKHLSRFFSSPFTGNIRVLSVRVVLVHKHHLEDTNIIIVIKVLYTIV